MDIACPGCGDALKYEKKILMCKNKKCVQYRKRQTGG